MPDTMKSTPDTARQLRRRSFWGFVVIVLCSLLLYNALLFSSFYNELWQNAEASAQVIATTLRTKVAMGVRLGKQLHSFNGIQTLLQNVGGDAQSPVAILDTQKNILHFWGQFPSNTELDAVTPEQITFLHGIGISTPTAEDSVYPLPQGRCLLSPVQGREGERKGYIAVYIAARPIYTALTELCMAQVWIQLCTTLLGLGVLWLLLQKIYPPAHKRHTAAHAPCGQGAAATAVSCSAEPEGPPAAQCADAAPQADTAESSETTPSRRFSATHASIAVFLLIMLCNGCVAVYDFAHQYTAAMQRDALRTAAVLRNDLNRLMLVGVSLNNSYQIEGYLQRIAAMHHDTIVLAIRSAQGKFFASSTGQDPTEEILVADSVQRLPLAAPSVHMAQGEGRTDTADARTSAPSAPDTARPAPLSAPQQPTPDTQQADAQHTWELSVGLRYAPWWSKVLNTCLDIITIAAIALIFMIETLLLLARSLSIHHTDPVHLAEKRSELFRPLMFFFLLAMDMTVSFIPLRMAEMTAATGENAQLLGLALSKELLLGLPISAEMAMTGLSVLVAGTWLKKCGARMPFIVGIACVAAGYTCSMLAYAPWQFIAARALCGLGYGFTLLTAQAVTVKSGRLADMFAGVYAGSLCGSALGAMLAERFGYAPVFGVSAGILLCLLLVPCVWLRTMMANAHSLPEDCPSSPSAQAPTPATGHGAADAPTTAATACNATAQPSPEAAQSGASLCNTQQPAGAPASAATAHTADADASPRHSAPRPWTTLLWDRRLLGLLLLGVVPSAIVTVGFLNYFLPIYLKSAGVGQANIGRIYMLNCLITIYSGPLLAAWVLRSAHKERMVCAAGILAALALLGFVFLSPLAAALAGSVLLGFATGLNIPAYSEFLLECDLAKTLGVDQSISLLDALQRLGQVLGPLCFGVALAALTTEKAALWSGLGFVGVSVFFVLLIHRKERALAAAPRTQDC